MQDNPFYKIQKKRFLKAKMNPKISEVVKQKSILLDEGSVNSLEPEKKLFHNESLSKLVA
jgi:hypothetical protein